MNIRTFPLVFLVFCGCQLWPFENHPFQPEPDPYDPDLATTIDTSVYNSPYEVDTGEPFATTDWIADAPSTPLERGCYVVEDNFSEGMIRHIDPDTLVMTGVMPVIGFDLHSVMSLAWFDGSWLLAMDWGDRMIEVDAAGVATVHSQSPAALGNDTVGFWMASELTGNGGIAERYDTLADLAADQPAQAVGLPRMWSTRGSYLNGRLWGAWHATDHLEYSPLPSAAGVGTFWPEGYDDWVYGISAFEGAILILDDGSAGHPTRIRHYDPWSGAEVDAWQPPFEGWSVSGLWCTSGPE